MVQLLSVNNVNPNLKAMKKIKYIVVIFLIGGCAVPAPIIKLTPSTIQNKDYWNMGQQFVFTSNKNIWFDCAFNRVENGRIIYDVKVTNESDTAILVDPSLFFQRVFLNDSFKIAENHALDPEFILTRLQMDENIAVANSKNATAFAVTSAIITGGAVIAVASSKKDDETKEKMVNTIVASNDLAQVSASYAREDADIRSENNWTMRKSLAERFLRKTTLPKGYYIDGEVHFTYFDNTKWYEIVLVAESAEATFLFKQNIINPQISY